MFIISSMWKHIVYSVILAALIFFIDLMSPLGVAGGVLYIILVLYGWNFSNKSAIFSLAGISTILTLVGYFMSPDGVVAWIVLTNRLLAILAIWVTAFSIYTIKLKQEKLDIAIEASEELQQKLIASLKSTSKANKIKSEFLAAMSHDLRTPLNAIIGFSEAIKLEVMGAIKPKVYQNYATDIHTSSLYLLELINDILDLSKLEAKQCEINKEHGDAKDILDECYNILKMLAENHDINFTKDVRGKLPPVFADQSAIKKILMNIITNAIKYTPAGGKVKISVTMSNEGHLFDVTDNGIGISENHIEEITKPFSRITGVDSQCEIEGTGLGLAIVKSLVALHDGKLNIVSSLGKGTSVTVLIPLKSS